MDFFALAEKARRGLEQAGADISKHAKQVLQDPNRAAEDAKRIAGDLFQGVQQAATNFDLGRTTEQAIKHIQQAAASIDLSAAASDVQNTAAGTFKTINEAASRINIEQILANSHSDAERIANEVFNTINLPGAVQSANHWVQDGLSIAEQRFTTFDLSHTVTDAMRWVEAHPIQTALLVANILLLLAPELLTGPLLALAGFGAEGVAAGSLAAAWQANIGPIAAGSAFAGLQSAGAAGYGLSLVNGVVQGGAGIAEAVIIAIEAAKAEKQQIENPKEE